MIIIGINAFHGDSSACLISDGVLVAAAEEERFRRIKHWAGFPAAAIRYCLGEGGIQLRDVSHVAINQDAGANLWRKIGFAIFQRPDFGLIRERLRNRRKRRGIREVLEKEIGGGFTGEFHQIEHHLAHLASAFHVSPFEKALAVSVDGFGDFASAAWGVGDGPNVSVNERVFFPHSLGIFYQALTQYLGFPHYGDEYKVMGLAPYGEPRFMDTMRKIVGLETDGTFRLGLEYFRHHREKIDYQWESGGPVFGKLYSDRLETLLGPARSPDEPLAQRHKDIARSVQGMYEEAFFHLLNTLHEAHGFDALALAGGCAMNSVANGKVYERTPFRKLYVQAAAGDAGGAIGAALAVASNVSGGGRFVMEHAYWGPHFSNAEAGSILRENQSEIDAQNCEVRQVMDEAELCEQIARSVADGKVVGWFQGRMEWGPRALGNRSIVCDPRRGDMKSILNEKIKRRESFRPFAPSILRDAVAEWFDTDDDVPFMMKVFSIRPEKRPLIPAVTHVDGTGRLQTVTEATNPRYYRLIGCFRDLTGVPLVLNTSFNENEPVVCRPEEALDCFLRTRMDVLVIQDWVVERQG